MRTARRRLDGSLRVTIFAPHRLTREECAAALLLNPRYDPQRRDYDRTTGLRFIREALSHSSAAVAAADPPPSPALDAALADVDRWHILAAPNL